MTQALIPSLEALYPRCEMMPNKAFVKQRIAGAVKALNLMAQELGNTQEGINIREGWFSNIKSKLSNFG